MTRFVKLSGILAILLFLVSCNVAGDGTVLPGKAVDTKEPTPAVTSVPTPKEDIPPISTASATPLSEEIGVTATNESTSSAISSRCGIFLPILPSNVDVQDAPFDFSIPGGVIPDSAYPALEQIKTNPQTVGLAAFEIGREEQGVYLNADVPMPLASVVKIINLVAYAEAADRGILDPAEWIPLDDLNKSYLPGSDRGAHQRALDELETLGLIGRDPPSIPLEEIPWMMIRHSSNAASDYLQLRLGQEAIEETAIRLGLHQQTAPCPWIGQFLLMNSHETLSNSNQNYVQSLIDDPQKYSLEVMRLTQTFTENQSFRDLELSQRWRSSFNTQMLFSNNLNSHGSAGDYATLLSKIFQNQLSSDYVNILVRQALEWPSLFEANQEYFDIVGYKDGSLPGVLTTAYYARRRIDGAQLVVVLFYHDLPSSKFRDWRQNLPHDELARWLLIDPQAIPILKQLIE